MPVLYLWLIAIVNLLSPVAVFVGICAGASWVGLIPWDISYILKIGSMGSIMGVILSFQLLWGYRRRSKNFRVLIEPEYLILTGVPPKRIIRWGKIRRVSVRAARSRTNEVVPYGVVIWDERKDKREYIGRFLMAGDLKMYTPLEGMAELCDVIKARVPASARFDVVSRSQCLTNPFVIIVLSDLLVTIFFVVFMLAVDAVQPYVPK